MNRQWSDYQKDFDYAAGIRFADTCNAVLALMGRITGDKAETETK